MLPFMPTSAGSHSGSFAAPQGEIVFFVVGWFVGLVLHPLKILWPQSAVSISYIGAFGLAVALFAALALLIDHLEAVDSSGTTNAT